jgi:hypothetical protein
MMLRLKMPYSIEEHRHRFAVWAAGRAATVNGCRFKVEQGKEIIELLTRRINTRHIIPIML